MAITTDNGKLAVMEWGDPWEPGLPLSPGTIGQADQQQFLLGFPENLWGFLDAFVRAASAMIQYVAADFSHGTPSRLHTSTGVVFLMPGEDPSQGTIRTTDGVITLAGPGVE